MESSPDSPLIRILFLGDIVGEPGRKAVVELLPQLKQELEIDFIIVNGENAAAGRLRLTSSDLKEITEAIDRHLTPVTA